MLGTSDGMVYDDEYHFQAASSTLDSSSPMLPEDNSSYNPFDPDADQTRPDPSLGDQIPFILHPGQDIIERDPDRLKPGSFIGKDGKLPSSLNPMGGVDIPNLAPDNKIQKETPGYTPQLETNLEGLTKLAANENPNVSSDATLDKDAFSNRFKGTVLADKADAIDMSAKKYGVPADLAASIMAHETGNGKSQQVNKYNNPAGMMHGNQPMLFKDINEGIDHAVRNIAHQWQNAGKSLEGLQKIYAPIGAANDPKGLNKDWLPGVSKIMKSLGLRGVPSDVNNEEQP